MSNIKKSEEEFAVSPELDFSRFYDEFTPEMIQSWEEISSSNASATWNGQIIRRLLPFVKKVMPRVGTSQSQFGLSLILLSDKPEREKEIVEYGLEPLVKADIITRADANKIVYWYETTEPTWGSGGSGWFRIEFEIEGIRYEIRTDSYRNCRSLSLTAK